MEVYVLDTNLFFNMEPGLGIAKNTQEVLEKLTKAARILKETKRGVFYMPIRVVDELLSFFEAGQQESAHLFLKEITTKSPDISKMKFEASVFYTLIDDIRARNLRGQAISEDEIQKAARSTTGMGQPTKQEFEMKVGPAIKSFRERYRQATRGGFLDSVADLDLIVLAQEVNGFVVSSDEGLLKWGRYFGVKEMRAQVFGTLVKDLLH